MSTSIENVESGDVLARDRLLPECREGDILLFANAGAYGRVMASRYNLREPAAEEVIDVYGEITRSGPRMVGAR